eukprot:scaffold108465_cov71-Phaeocystis_antarctica.AAC.2
MQRRSEGCVRGGTRPAASGRARRALLGPSPQDRSLFGAMAVMTAPIRARLQRETHSAFSPSSP